MNVEYVVSLIFLSESMSFMLNSITSICEISLGLQEYKVEIIVPLVFKSFIKVSMNRSDLEMKFNRGVVTSQYKKYFYASQWVSEELVKDW